MVKINDTSAQDRTVNTAPRRRRRIIFIGTALLITAIGISFAYPAFKQYSDSDSSISRQRVRFATVTRGPFQRDISVTGKAVAAVSPTLYSPAPGTVALAVQAGDLVTRGQVVVEIDSPELKNEWLQEGATLASLRVESERQAIDARQEALRLQQTADLARVSAQAAERELKRARTSFDQQLISAQDYERKQDELASAQLALKHAEQDAQLATERLAFEARSSQLAIDRQQLVVDELERQIQALTIQSPVDGIVGTLQVDQKAVVNLNQALLTVVDLSALEIELEIPETYARELSPGMAITLSYNNQNHAAQLSAISPEVNNSQVTARARFTASAPPTLKQNQRVSARIVLEAKEETLLVDRGPFLDSGQGRIAYVVAGDLAVRRRIRTGAVSIGAVEILEGLQPGDVIIQSNTSVFDGAEQVLLTQ